MLKGLKWSPEEINKFTAEAINEVMTSTTKVNEAMGGNGSPKPTFYSTLMIIELFCTTGFWMCLTHNSNSFSSV